MSGKFRHRVNFMRDVSPDGTIEPDWKLFLCEIPCNVLEVGGGEKYRGKQLQAETSIVIETRHYDGIKQNMIAVNVLTGVEYTINKINNRHGRSRFLMLEATEVDV